MDAERVNEMLREIMKRLDIIEAKIQITSLAERRQQSLERYRVAYNRQNGYPAHVVLPTNPEGEDEID